jgi:hypothetical protein
LPAYGKPLPLCQSILGGELIQMALYNNGYLKQHNYAEQKLYDHLLYAVQTQAPDALLDHFRHLFIDGAASQDLDVNSLLTAIVNSGRAEEEFKFILNRCCHIIINRWQMNASLQTAIPDLIGLFQQVQSPGLSASPTGRRLRLLVKDFTKTEQYLTLERLSRVIAQNQATKAENALSVGNLINRYPYLYEHCLLSEDSSFEHQQTVRRIQHQIQHQFELDLSQYVTYKVRLAHAIRQTGSLEQAQRKFKDFDNPTLLTDGELGAALKHYVGKVEGNYTYRDLSNSFLLHTQHTHSYQDFKDDLFEYLRSSVDPKYGKRRFNDKLYQKLQEILPECNSRKPDEFLMLRTSSNLLNYLVVESPQRPQHYVFADLITNLGPTVTTGLLLKIVLLCRKVKPYLEKRFSILFSHYESCAKDGVPWLVKALDNLQLAFSVHFGKADVSCLKYLM